MAVPSVEVRQPQRPPHVVVHRSRGRWRPPRTQAASAAPAQTPPVTRRLGALQGIGIALSLLGLVVVAFGAYLYGWSNVQASHEQDRLLASYQTTGRLAAFRGRAAVDGAMVAVLRIPSLGLDDAVVEGTSPSDLESGPGLMPSTALPGSIGDAVIAARHGTFGAPFGRLSSLRPGDRISIVDYEGRFTYAVESVRTLPAGSGLRVTRTRSALLTLVTSASSFPPSGLVVASAKLVGRSGHPAASARPVSASELALGGEVGAWWQLLGWLVLLVLALAVAVVAYRRSGRPVLVYVLSTPVVLVVSLFSFESLSRLLPATM